MDIPCRYVHVKTLNHLFNENTRQKKKKKIRSESLHYIILNPISVNF